jgi:Short C-terminal domain
VWQLTVRCDAVWRTRLGCEEGGIVGLLRKSLYLGTSGIVAPNSKKHRMAMKQLAALQGRSEAEIRRAGGRYDFAGFWDATRAGASTVSRPVSSSSRVDRQITTQRPANRQAGSRNEDRGLNGELLKMSYDGSEPLDQVLRGLDSRHELDFGSGVTVMLHPRKLGFALMDNGHLFETAGDPLEAAQKIVAKLASLLPTRRGQAGNIAKEHGRDTQIIKPSTAVALDGDNAVRETQKQVVQFDALARASVPAATEHGSDPAARFRKLQELRDAGLLTQEEYETKRTEVINSI